MIKKKILKYGIFYPVTGVLWFLAVFLSLDLLALTTELWREHHNPLLVAYKNHQPLPLKGNDSQADKDKVGVPNGWDDNSKIATTDFSSDPFLQQVLDWGPRDIYLPVEEQQKRRLLSVEMTPLAREAYAQMNGEVILRIDQQYHVREVYGFFKSLLTGFKKFLFHQMLLRTPILESLHEAIAKTLEDGQIRFSTTINPDGEPLKFVCFPALQEEGVHKSVFVFFEFHPELASTHDEEIDASNRWVVHNYKYKPNYYPMECNSSFSTNEFGFYDDSVQVPKPEQIFRIVCVGGSTTEEGYTKEETYPSMLEKLLKKSMPGCGIEVLNAGTPGTFAYTHLLRFNDYAALQPNMFILHLGVNDTLLQYSSEHINILPSISRFIRVFCPSVTSPNTDTFSRKHYINMGFPLELFIQLALRRGITVVLASIAHPNTGKISTAEQQYFVYNANSEWLLPAFNLSTYISYINASNHILYQIAEKYGLDYIPIAEQITGGTDTFRDLCHMTQFGINRKAQLFCDLLHPILSLTLPEKYFTKGSSVDETPSL
ncbi:MAG: hypothetical protein GXY07_04945 [Candidatus Hydrogenedentes bacterium]|nr:hypothetical protein [Candidatus Hydrogenedentota bacterium]